jgi:nucleoside-diphosphate-sugar epimerase
MTTVLVTGANGEIGHGLIPALNKLKFEIIALDLKELDDTLKTYVHETVIADILDSNVIQNILSEHKISTIFHLAGILSSGAEKNPDLAQKVNAGGTAALLESANSLGIKEKRSIKFIFPSTIAVYGIPNLETKNKVEKVKESEFLQPNLMYGINKLYCEMLGKYYSTNYRSIENSGNTNFIDFRAIRFPGIISALTLPSGGTTDYGPEMIHTAAQGKNYESFVREDTKLPFMVMPDAIKAMLSLSEAPKEKLSQTVYNVTSFSIQAKEIADLVLKVFPDTEVSYNPNIARQKIVDSWPADIDDSTARRDWNWQPDYDVTRAFKEYLIPEIQKKYTA